MSHMWRSATDRSTAGSRTPRSPNGAPIPRTTSLPTKPSSRPGAQQQRGPSHPNAAAAAAAVKFPKSSFLASAKGPNRTRNQLPCSPLAARDDNIPRLGRKSWGHEGAAGSKVLQRRSATSSHVRPDPTPRSSGPRTPSSARTRPDKPFAAPTRGIAGISSSDAGPENAKAITAVGAGAASVVSLVDTRQAEQEFLAAFKTTPKVRRTPPGSASRSSSDAGSENMKPNAAVGAGEAPVVSLVDTRQAEQEFLAAFKTTPKLRRTPPGGASRIDKAPPARGRAEGRSCVRSPTPTAVTTPPRVSPETAGMTHHADSNCQVEAEASAAAKASTFSSAHGGPHGVARGELGSRSVGPERIKPIITGEGTGMASVASPLDTCQAEDKILAAFSKTPKVRRTPPGGLGNGRVSARSALAVPRVALERTEITEQQGSGKSDTDLARLAVAAVTQTEATRSYAGAHAVAAMTAERTKPLITGEGTGTASVASPLDTRQAEEKILAAFSKTPKIQRTPPGELGNGRVSARPVVAVPRVAPERTEVTEQQGLGKSDTDLARLAVAAVTQTEATRSHAGAHAVAAMTAERTKPLITGEGTGTASVAPPLDTRQAEEKIIAAFSKTPKIRRTPPGGLGNGLVSARSVVAVPRAALERTEVTEQQGLGKSDTDPARLAVAAGTQKEATRSHAAHAVAAMTAERTKLLITGEGTGTASVAPPLDTRQAEEKILAAFSTTPKVRRTPPGGLGNGLVSARSVVAVPRVALERTEVTEQQGSGKSDTDLARLAVAAVTQTEGTRSHAGAHAVAAVTAESKAEKVTASQPGAESQPRNDDSDATLPRAQGEVDIQRPRKTWAERAQILARRRENKLPITFPQTNGGKYSVSSERQALPMKHKPEFAAKRESKGAERRAMEESSVDSVRGASTRVERELFVENNGRKDGREHTTVAVAACGQSDINGRQQQDHLPRFSPTRPERVAAGKNRFENRAEPSTALAGGGSPCRPVSPSLSVESADSAANINLRILEESASAEEPFGGATVGRLGSKMTPAMFKGLVEGMRTPSTGTERSGRPARKVQAMKLLDLGSAQPPTAKINPAGSSKPSAPFPPAALLLARRIDTGRSVRYSSSSVEAAAAAKRAAANKSKTNKPKHRNASANDNGGACSSDARSSTGNIEAVAEACEVEASGKAGPPSGAATEEAICYAVEASHVGVNTSRQSSRAPPRAGGDGPGDAGVAPQGGQEPSGDVAGVVGIDSFLRSPVARASPAEAISGCGQDVEVDDATVLGGSSSSSHPVAATVPAQDGCDQDARPLPEMMVVSDPFARTSEIPRTPVEQAASSLLGGEGGGDRDGGAARVEGRDQDVLLPGDLRTAHQQIGELRREMACLTDRVAKQTGERKRLAEVAFKAQDEAADLRKQLRELEQNRNQRQDREQETHANVGTADDVLPRLDGEVDSRRHAGTGGVAKEVIPSGRELELELEVREAQEETRHAKVALEAARAKIRELSLKVEEVERARFEEQLRWARERFEQDEKAIEEHQRKVKMFTSRTQTEDLRVEALTKDKEEMEQSLRSAVAALAGKARVMLEAFVTQDKRMAAQIDCLRESVKEHEHRISEMMEKSTLREEAVRLAHGETLEARQQLLEAEEGLAAARERLGELENQYREAQSEQTYLRERVATGEARCVSLEQQLSEVKRSGEEMADMERSSRQSVEQRLGAAERARDELVAAAAEAADSALRAAAKAERDRWLVERRLDEAVRARDELSVTVARTAAAVMAPMASAGSTAPAGAGVSLGPKANAQLSPPTLPDVFEARDEVGAEESSKADNQAVGSNADFHNDGEGPDAGAFTTSDADVITAPDADVVAASDADVHGAAVVAKNTVEGVEAYLAGPVHGPRRASKRARSSGYDRSVDNSPQRETLGRATESVELPKPAGEECSQSTKTSSLGNLDAAGANVITPKLRNRPKVSYAEGDADSESSGGEGVVIGRARSRSRAPTRPRIPARGDGAPSSSVLVGSSEASANEDAQNQPCEKPQAYAPHVRKEASAGGDLVGKINFMMDVNSDCDGLLESRGEAEDHADARLVETRTSDVKKPRRATKAGDRECGSEGENSDDGAAASHDARRSGKRDKSAQSCSSSSAAAAVRSSEASPVRGEKHERENDAGEAAQCREESIIRGQGKKGDGAGEEGGSSRGKVTVRSVRHKVAKSLTASTPEGRQSSAVEEDQCDVSSVSEGMGTMVNQIDSTSESDRARDKQSGVQCGTSLTRQGHDSKSGEDLAAGELKQSGGSRGEALRSTALTTETNARASSRKGAAPQKRRPPVSKVRGKAYSDAVAAGANAVTDASAADAGADADRDAAEISDAYTGFDKTTAVEGIAVPAAGLVEGTRRPSKRAHSGDCDDIGDESGSSPAPSQVTGSAKRLGTTKLAGKGGRSQAPIPSDLEEGVARVPPAAFPPVGEAGTRMKLRKRSKVNYTEGNTDSERYDGQVGAGRPRSRGRSSARMPARVPPINGGARSRRFLALESSVEKDERSPREGTPVRAPRGRKETSAGGGNIGHVSTTMNVDNGSGDSLESPGDTGDFAAARAFEVPAPVAASAAVSKKIRKLGRVANADHPEREFDGHGDSAAEKRLARRSTRSNKNAPSHLPPAAAATPSPEARPVEGGVGEEKEEVNAAPRRKTLAGKGRDSRKAAGKGGDDVGSRGKVQARGGRRRVAQSVMAPTPDIDESTSAIKDARDVTAAIREGRESTMSQRVLTINGGSARAEDAAARLLEASSAKQNLGSNAGEDTIRDREDVDTEDGVSEHPESQSVGMPLVATALVDRTNVRESLRIETTIQEGRPLETAEDLGKSRAGINGTSREPEQEVDLLPEEVDRSSLSEASTSFAAPPARKRPRKLLGGGASRCKTPKGKNVSKYKADSITADVAAPKGQAADDRASEVTVKVGVGPRSGRKVSLGRQSAADRGPLSAAGASSRAGGGSGASVRGVGGTANPALKTKRRSTASILAMRGKPLIRGSLFQGFLDPRKGFTVPKLKAGACRP